MTLLSYLISSESEKWTQFGAMWWSIGHRARLLLQRYQFEWYLHKLIGTLVSDIDFQQNYLVLLYIPTGTQYVRYSNRGLPTSE